LEKLLCKGWNQRPSAIIYRHEVSNRGIPDISDILARKAAGRRQLAALSFGEKLKLLDGLRERRCAVRAPQPRPRPASATEKGQKNSAAAGNFFRDGLRSSIKHLILL